MLCCCYFPQFHKIKISLKTFSNKKYMKKPHFDIIASKLTIRLIDERYPGLTSISDARLMDLFECFAHSSILHTSITQQ